jgi:hypothetical protein
MPLTQVECRKAFSDTLSAVPAIGDNVKLREVKPNIDALADSVQLIVGSLADGVSDSGVDPAFWTWIASVGTWMQLLHTWQQAAEALQPTGVVVAPPPAPPISLMVDVR